MRFLPPFLPPRRPSSDITWLITDASILVGFASSFWMDSCTILYADAFASSDRRGLFGVFGLADCFGIDSPKYAHFGHTGQDEEK